MVGGPAGRPGDRLLRAARGPRDPVTGRHGVPRELQLEPVPTVPGMNAAGKRSARARWAAHPVQWAGTITLFLSIDAEHRVGYASDLDLAPDRAPAGQLVVAPQRGDAGQPADPARVRRVGGVEAALHQGEPGLAVRP